MNFYIILMHIFDPSFIISKWINKDSNNQKIFSVFSDCLCSMEKSDLGFFSNYFGVSNYTIAPLSRTIILSD